MVVSPKEALENITEEESKQLVRLEEKLDAELKTKYEGKLIIIDVKKEELPRDYALETLLSKYRADGWSHVKKFHQESSYSDGTHFPEKYFIRFAKTDL
jgi:hypothetical protein